MDQKLKQRLVGAVVLISLAVIFIPIILEGPDDEWSPQRQGMPEPPKIDYRAEIELPPVAAEPSVEPAPVLVEPVPEQAAPPQGTGKAPATQAPPVAPQPEPPPPVPVAAVAVPADAWVIQVGSFSLQPNARGLSDRLRRAGYKAFLREGKTASGDITYRVLVGPLAERAVADKLQERLNREQQLKGLVMQDGG